MLPTIPAKRYFTIGEVAELCEVKPHVLRYWEQEFTQLRPIKRRGNRRYYQHHEVLMIRRIRDLLYGQGFTINGARNRLQESADEQRNRSLSIEPKDDDAPSLQRPSIQTHGQIGPAPADALPAPHITIAPQAETWLPRLRTPAASTSSASVDVPFDPASLREELLQLRALLCAAPPTPSTSSP